ncbi:hypothetical protein [Oculatella sp. LEGE 06141]|uniref:hypothetical protein n=1 Tax=Oculatella sp. LEGE 06141 TaxID=1828648 RepID=UPI001D1477A4|nr:hypothetical protein [Oculatella sp. LEGE 06141]
MTTTLAGKVALVTGSSRGLGAAIDYIQAHLNRALSLVELANVVNISPTYLLVSSNKRWGFRLIST